MNMAEIQKVSAEQYRDLRNTVASDKEQLKVDEQNIRNVIGRLNAGSEAGDWDRVKHDTESLKNAVSKRNIDTNTLKNDQFILDHSEVGD
jgi:hypothetical protein